MMVERFLNTINEFLWLSVKITLAAADVNQLKWSLTEVYPSKKPNEIYYKC